MKQRDFVQAAAAAIGVASIPQVVWGMPSDHRFVKQIGLQLWTVRNQIAADLKGTIKAIADAGYWQVELGDVMKSDEIIAVAEEHGLKVTSSFFDWNVIGSPAKPVKFELDVFWAQIGGLDALKAIAQLQGRIAQLHLKDLKKDTPVIHDEGVVPADAFKELGNGVIDIAAVMKAGDACGVEQCHVEQDQSPNPIDSIGQSFRHLKKI